MLAAGVEAGRIYEDLASGRRDDRPGLAACLKAIQPGTTTANSRLAFGIFATFAEFERNLIAERAMAG